MTKQEFLAYLREQVAAHGSQKHAAQQWGISTAFLCDILHQRREPSPKLLAALGAWREVRYHLSAKSAEEREKHDRV